MGLGLGGLQSGGSVGQTLAQLVGQAITALKITLTQVAGQDAVNMSTGARLHLSGGASEYLSGDGAGTVTVASSFTVTGNLTSNGVAGSTAAGLFTTAAYQLGAGLHTFISSTAPTISSGFGTTPSVAASNGTAAFTINVGGGGAASSGVIALPTATTGWVVVCANLSSNDANHVQTKMTANTNATATIGNFTSAGTAGAWAANDIIACIAMAY